MCVLCRVFCVSMSSLKRDPTKKQITIYKYIYIYIYIYVYMLAVSPHPPPQTADVTPSFQYCFLNVQTLREGLQ
jgi:hypothetical protein